MREADFVSQVFSTIDTDSRHSESRRWLWWLSISTVYADKDRLSWQRHQQFNAPFLKFNNHSITAVTNCDRMQTDWLTDWLTDCLTDWLSDWLKQYVAAESQPNHAPVDRHVTRNSEPVIRCRGMCCDLCQQSSLITWQSDRVCIFGYEGFVASLIAHQSAIVGM